MRSFRMHTRPPASSKNVVTAPNISVGDYTYYDDTVDPTGFERNNVLFNYPEFGDHFVIGKFCQIASTAACASGLYVL